VDGLLDEPSVELLEKRLDVLPQFACWAKNQEKMLKPHFKACHDPEKTDSPSGRFYDCQR
jgi:hypothetical protein